MDFVIVSGILLALLLNFVNGINDASHSIATVVETRALSPWRASILSALANFIGPFVFTTAVAATIGTALVIPEALTPLSIIIAMLTAIFLVVSVVVARFKGLRAFVATGASLALIIAFIIPAMIAGYNPILVSMLGVGGILILAIYFVHGVNWSTTAALVGTLGASFVTLILGLVFTELAHLTGYGTEEGMMISFAAGDVDLKGLLLAGLIIGALPCSRNH